MGLLRTVPPSIEVVSLEEMKSHLREEGTEQDQLIASLVAAAVEHTEVITARALGTQTWRLTLDRFPCDSGPIRLPRPPLQSVTSIQYVDPDGTTQTLDPATYRVSAGDLPGRITLEYDQRWPETRAVADAVAITYVAGYGGALDVPDSLKAAIRLMVGHWYEHREAAVTGTIATELPLAVDALLWANRYIEA